MGEISTWRRDTPAVRRMIAEEVAVTDATELVSVLLEERGVNRSDLAERLDVTRSEITQRLNGKRNLTVKSLAAMMHELGYRLQFGVADLATSAGAAAGTAVGAAVGAAAERVAASAVGASVPTSAAPAAASATPARAFHFESAAARESGARYSQTGTRLSAVPNPYSAA